MLYGLKKILEARSNKQLLHRNCHRYKHASDKKLVFKFKEDYSNALKRILDLENDGAPKTEMTVTGARLENPTSSELDTAKINALIEAIEIADNQAIIRQRSENTWNKIQRLLWRSKKKDSRRMDAAAPPSAAGGGRIGWAARKFAAGPR